MLNLMYAEYRDDHWRGWKVPSRLDYEPGDGTCYQIVIPSSYRSRYVKGDTVESSLSDPVIILLSPGAPVVFYPYPHLRTFEEFVTEVGREMGPEANPCTVNALASVAWGLWGDPDQRKNEADSE